MRIRLSLLNAQGLVTKFTNKLHSHELRLIFSQSDFVLLTETWASDIAHLSVDGFILIQLNRVEKKQKKFRWNRNVYKTVVLSILHFNRIRLC